MQQASAVLYCLHNLKYSCSRAFQGIKAGPCHALSSPRQECGFTAIEIATYPEENNLTKAHEVAVCRAMHYFARKHPRCVVTDSKWGRGQIALVPRRRRFHQRPTTGPPE